MILLHRLAGQFKPELLLAEDMSVEAWHRRLDACLTRHRIAREERRKAAYRGMGRRG